MEGVRYTPYKHNSVMTAIHEGEIQKVRELISSRGLFYAQEWSDASDGYDLLCTAVEKQYTEIAKLLLTNGAKVNNEKNSSSNTPLHFAILNGDVEIVQTLLDKGANINAANLYGKTALHNAVEGMSMEIIGMLLIQEVNIDAADKNDITPLHLAIINNSKEIATLLLSKGANVNGKTSDHSAADKGDTCTPLHLAVEKGNEEIIELLVSSGANVNAKGNNGVTSLHIATEKGNVQIVKQLLKHGADVNSPYTSTYLMGYTPLHFAVENGSEEIIKLLLSKSTNVNCKGKHGVTCLHIASERGYLQIVEQLLDHEADINSAYVSSIKRGCTPLHLAAEKGDDKIVELLLLRGANVNAAGRHSITPLHIASERGYLQIVEYLLQYGANVYSLYGKGHTPMSLAVANEHEKVVKLLLPYGIYFDPVDQVDKSMLHFFVEKGCSTVVEYILTHCFDQNNPSNSRVLNAAVQGYGMEYRKIIKHLLEYGFTVDPRYANNFMLAAVEKGYLEFVNELLKKYEINADLLYDPISTKGRPLHLATQNGHKEVAELLIAHGAYVNAQDETGKTPLFYAAENADLSMTKLLLNNEANIINYPGVLNTAVKEDRREIVEVLLEHGADITATDEHGRMPLHFITLEEGEKNFKFHHRRNPTVKGEIARLLLYYGADANARARGSMPMLHAAIDNNYVEVIEALLEHNADVNSTYEGGVTPLHRSAILGNKVITEMLLKKKANINAVDHDEKTALHFATDTGHEEIVELLLKRRAKVDAARKNDCATPLHLAAKSGYLAIAKHLLEFGAKVDSTLEPWKFTALHEAALNNHVEIVYLLLKFGASIDFADQYGTTSLHYACRRGHERIVKALLEHGSDMTIASLKGTPYQLTTDRNKSMASNFDDDLYYYIEYVCSINVNIARILERHMVKLKAANLYSGLSIQMGDEYEDLDDFRTSCKKEVARMKNEKFVNTDITFYDIVKKDAASQLVAYARNENIRWVFESPHYKTYFPIYAGMLTNNFRKGERRRDALEQGKKIFGILFKNSPVLPRFICCVEKLLSYLNDENLRNLINAVSFVVDRDG